MKNCIFFLIMLFFIPIGNSYSADKNYYYKIIGEVWKSKNYSTGVRALEKAVKEHPETPDFYSNLIFFYYHLKHHKKGYLLAEKAYPKFSDNKNIRNATRTALMNYGWHLNKEKKFDHVFKIFAKAYDIDPDDQWVMNGYGYILKVKKKYSKAIQILEEGMKRYPQNKYLRGNLVWTIWEQGDRHFKNKNHSEAYQKYKKAFSIHDKKDINIFNAYLYKLSPLKKFNEAFLVIKEAKNRYPKAELKLYKPIYWIYHHLAFNQKDKKDYKSMVKTYQTLYRFAKKNDQIWHKKRSFSHLALSNFNFQVMNIVSGICHYWQKFDPSQREKAYRYLEYLKKDMPKDLQFIYYRYYGHILYRDNKIERARKILDKAYKAFFNSPIGSEYKVKRVIIPFPLKGYFFVGGNLSEYAITHMGLNQYCYDITGSDSKGNRTKIGTNRKSVDDYFGFGKVIVSPVNGEVINVVGHYPDDPVSGTPTNPEGNHMQILSDNKIFHFVHLKQNSILVKKGDRVIVGQAIAGLGNSSSTIPHLHFGVYSKDWLVSYPVYFKNYTLVKNGKKRLVKSGRPGGDGGTDLIFAE